jgi:hypothetical protein
MRALIKETEDSSRDLMALGEKGEFFQDSFISLRSASVTVDTEQLNTTVNALVTEGNSMIASYVNQRSTFSLKLQDLTSAQELYRHRINKLEERRESSMERHGRHR